MAKVKNPFLSLIASGTFAGIMTANRGKNGQIMRSAPIRKINSLTKAEIHTGTWDQAIRRAIMRMGIEAWQAMPEVDKDPYNQAAKPLQMSGYNLFIRNWLRNPPLQPGTNWDGGTTTWDDSSTYWDFTP